MMEKIKKNIYTEWEITDMGKPNKIIGIEILQTLKRICISQKRSIIDILDRQELGDASPVQMPLNLHIKISPNPDGNKGNRSNSYTKLLDKLQYITNCIHLEIAFIVNQLILYIVNSSM